MYKKAVLLVLEISSIFQVQYTLAYPTSYIATMVTFVLLLFSEAFCKSLKKCFEEDNMSIMDAGIHLQSIAQHRIFKIFHYDHV